MALRRASMAKKAGTSLNLVAREMPQFRHMASAASTNSTGIKSQDSKGPTAIVFLNMGGPSTTSEVGDFLSKLFVRYLQKQLGRTLLILIQG
jgi:hypothetical protein